MDRFPSYRTITYRTVTAGNRGYSSRSVSRGEQAVVEITDLQKVLKELSKINDEAHKQFKRNFREIAKPVQSEIKQGIRSNRLGTPGNMRGFKKGPVPGRLTWGTGKPAASAIISMPRLTSRKAGMVISKVTVGSPATVIADMAGKSNRKTATSSRTRIYPYSRSASGQRSHKITREGSRKFIQNLDTTIGNRASRIVYPSAEKALPAARTEMGRALDQMVTDVNRELRKAN